MELAQDRVCWQSVVLAVLNSKVLLAESLMARRELDRNGVQFPHTENTRKLCPCVGKHDAGFRKAASLYSCVISAAMLCRYSFVLLRRQQFDSVCEKCIMLKTKSFHM